MPQTRKRLDDTDAAFHDWLEGREYNDRAETLLQQHYSVPQEHLDDGEYIGSHNYHREGPSVFGRWVAVSFTALVWIITVLSWQVYF